MRNDGDFDLIGDAFEADVYGSSKGLVRMTVLWDDLLTAVPRLNGPGLNILDAGGGAGHLAVRLAQLGHRVVLAEPANEMRERAQTAIQAAGIAGPGHAAAPLQGLDDVLHEVFDLVVCHAVLEWLADPSAALILTPGRRAHRAARRYASRCRPVHVFQKSWHHPSWYFALYSAGASTLRPLAGFWKRPQTTW